MATPGEKRHMSQIFIIIKDMCLFSHGVFKYIPSTFHRISCALQSEKKKSISSDKISMSGRFDTALTLKDLTNNTYMLTVLVHLGINFSRSDLTEIVQTIHAC